MREGWSNSLATASPSEVCVEEVEVKGFYCSFSGVSLGMKARLSFMGLCAASCDQEQHGSVWFRSKVCECVQGERGGRGRVRPLHVEAISGLSGEAHRGGGVAIAWVSWLGSHWSRRGRQHQLLACSHKHTHRVTC